MKKFEERFWSKVKRIPFHECWEWLGATRGGYGRLCRNRQWFSAHRISYELTKGMIPKGMCVCHSCDNPGCVRPDHLFLGTHVENMKDMVKKGRASKRKGSSHPRSKLTENKIVEIRKENLSMSKIAAKYGIGKTTVFHILNKNTWNHIK